MLCEGAGKAFNHRIGGPKCIAPYSRGKLGVFRRSPTKSPTGPREEGLVGNGEPRTNQEEQIDPIMMREEQDVESDGMENMKTEELGISMESAVLEDLHGKDITSES